MSSVRISDEEARRMVALYLEGLAWNEIRVRLVEEGLPLRSGNGIRSTLARNGYQYQAPQLPAECLARIVELYGQGVSSNRIAQTLNEEGVPTQKRVGRWHGPAVVSLLQREGVLTRSRAEALASLQVQRTPEREVARTVERERKGAEREQARALQATERVREKEEKRRAREESKALLREIAEREKAEEEAEKEVGRVRHLDPALLRAARAAHQRRVVRRAPRGDWF